MADEDKSEEAVYRLTRNYLGKKLFVFFTVPMNLE